MSTVTTQLFAYVDAETARIAMDSGKLEPTGPLGLVWLTNIGILQSEFVPEHMRGAVKLAVTDPTGIVPWLTVQEHYPLGEWMAWELEPKARPDLWYVAARPVPVRRAV